MQISKSTLFATVAFGALVLTANVGFAEDSGFKPYVSLFGGASFPGELAFHNTCCKDHYLFSLNSGYLLGGSIGVHVSDQFRAELELSRAFYKSNGKGHATNDGFVTSNAPGGIRATYLLANAWLDIQTDTAITPYIGGGIGAGWLGGDLHWFGANFGIGNEMSPGFAFQIGGGFKTALSPNISVDLGYRFKDIIGAKATNSNGLSTNFDQMNLSSHNIQIGLTYNF